MLLGLSNTAGVLAGVFGTAATGYILQHGILPDSTSWNCDYLIFMSILDSATVEFPESCNVVIV